MTVKRKHRLVDFIATSPRLGNVLRGAARRNKSLGRCAVIREIGGAGAHSASRARAPKLPTVMLSHVEDDYAALADHDLVSHSFHLLFTEPATHPDQVAQWMRGTKVRAENRLHIVRVDDLEASQVSDLLGRVCSSFAPDDNRGNIVDVYLGGDVLYVRGPRQRMVHVPVAAIPALRGQPRHVLRNFRIDPDGAFVHWPDIDAHLGWNQFLQAVDPAELHRARQRSADFNRRYGAAIRKVREAAGISQAGVEGITDRQLRRIEQGVCRATTNALRELAKAHGLDMNAYMEVVAQAMASRHPA